MPRTLRRTINDPSIMLNAQLWKHDGTVFYSDDAYGHQLTATGALWSSQGRTFDGNDDYINLDNVLSTLAATTQGTWATWVKFTDATPAAINALVCFGDTDQNERMLFVLETTGKLTMSHRVAAVDKWVLMTDAAIAGDNTWVHCAVTQNGVLPVIYINGVAVAQTFTTDVDHTLWFPACTGLDNGRIGTGNYQALGERWDLAGVVGETELFSRALSAAEVWNLYQATQWRYA